MLAVAKRDFIRVWRPRRCLCGSYQRHEMTARLTDGLSGHDAMPENCRDFKTSARTAPHRSHLLVRCHRSAAISPGGSPY